MTAAVSKHWASIVARRIVLLVVAALGLSPAFAATVQTQQLPPENLVAAQVLLPLLKDLHRRLQPHFRAWPGTLPPSPFTGQRTAIVAITIGRKQVEVDEDVKHALERLLKWDPTSATSSPEAMLFDEFLQQLKVKTGAFVAVQTDQVTCDTNCVMQRFTRLDHAFGRSRKQREDARDYLMLEALAAAVK